MLLGPTSSRLLKTSPIFVKRVEVTDVAKKGVLIYGFDREKPQLSLETNWTVSKYLIVSSYNRQGFSLWLNEGSRIHMRWEAHTSLVDHLQIVVIKGERNFETLTPSSIAASGHQVEGKEVEYVITESDKYYVSILNSNPKSTIMTMNVNVTSKMYDTTKASSVCSTTDGSCRLNLRFPNTQYVVLTTPNNGDLAGWYIELSFVSRIVTYVAILGCIVIIIFLILKYLGACNSENDGEEVTTTSSHTLTVPERGEQSETDPLMPKKPTRFTYGTGEEDLEVGSSSDGSSDELYDGKICVICYDEPRNCFFVPCGHCATCHDCALRILEGESRVCPICRRMIHKVRRLYTP